MELQVGVKILLKNPEGKYLIARRSPHLYRDIAGLWDIIGGRINPGQTLLENLRREVKEETALEIAGEPRLIAAQDILRIPGKHVVRLTYLGATDGTPRLNEEHSEFRWVSAEELKDFENLDVYLKEIIEKKILP